MLLMHWADKNVLIRSCVSVTDVDVRWQYRQLSRLSGRCTGMSSAIDRRWSVRSPSMYGYWQIVLAQLESQIVDTKFTRRWESGWKKWEHSAFLVRIELCQSAFFLSTSVCLSITDLNLLANCASVMVFISLLSQLSSKYFTTVCRFPTVQKFWKSVKIWQSYREFKGGNFFWDTV